MGHSEVSMKEGDVVELLKIGCAGWWYVKILSKSYYYVWNSIIFIFQLKKNFDFILNLLEFSIKTKKTNSFCSKKCTRLHFFILFFVYFFKGQFFQTQKFLKFKFQTKFSLKFISNHFLKMIFFFVGNNGGEGWAPAAFLDPIHRRAHRGGSKISAELT